MIDCKTSVNKVRLPSARRIIHIALGCVALSFCILALSPTAPVAKKETPNLSSKTISSSIASTIALNSAIVIDTNPSESNIENLPTDEKKTIAANDDKDQWETIKVKPKDTLGKIFARQGYSNKELHKILEAAPEKNNLKTLQPGQTLKLKVAEDKQIQGLTLEIAPGNSIIVSRKDDNFVVEYKQLPLEKQMAFGKGKIQNSLFGSAKNAGLDSKLVNQMVEIFGWNINFALDLKPNDTFRILFEEKYLDGERIETGNILAAEIVNKGKKHQAVRYTDKAGNTSYYSPDGYGMHLAFLRYPVTFTRISSGFGNRHHPILHKLRKHNGVDYSAPTGTPVQATGDAKVIFVGNRRGYGKVVELKHGARYSTLYAHLSRFAKNLRSGSAVKQGQVIGYVGQTGLATGPHLHYEFRVDGIHRDPLTVALPKKNPIADQNKPHFVAHVKEMLRLMDDHENKVKVARNEFLKNE